MAFSSRPLKTFLGFGFPFNRPHSSSALKPIVQCLCPLSHLPLCQLHCSLTWFSLFHQSFAMKGHQQHPYCQIWWKVPFWSIWPCWPCSSSSSRVVPGFLPSSLLTSQTLRLVVCLLLKTLCFPGYSSSCPSSRAAYLIPQSLLDVCLGKSPVDLFDLILLPSSRSAHEERGLLVSTERFSRLLQLFPKQADLLFFGCPK